MQILTVAVSPRNVFGDRSSKSRAIALVAGLVLLLSVECVRHIEPTNRQTCVLPGDVVDGAAQPLPGATVSMFDLGDVAPVSVNAAWPTGASLVAESVSADDGRFQLKIPCAHKLPERAQLIVSAPGRVTRSVSGAPLMTAIGKPLHFALQDQARIDAQFLGGPDGVALRDAEFGWFVQDATMLWIRYSHCCPDERGRFTQSIDSAGPYVWLFAIEHAPQPRYALSKVQVEPGQVLGVTLRADLPLHVIRGRLLTSEAAPLVAPLSLRAIKDTSPTLFEQVLRHLDSTQSNLDGTFEAYTTSSDAHELVVKAWTAGDGSRAKHIGYQEVAKFKLHALPDASGIDLTLSRTETLDCTVTNMQTNAPVLVDELGLWFGPHHGWGHDGDCVELRSGAASPSSVHFIWPQGASDVRLTARGHDPADPATTLVGTASRHQGLTTSCQIRAVHERPPM